MSASSTLVRVVSGSLTAEELAALTVVVLTRAADPDADPQPAPTPPAWLLPERYVSPQGWSDRRPG